MAHASVAAFIEAACVPLDAGHRSGTLEQARAILAEHPELAGSDLHTAAILGDEAGVRRFLALDRANATAKGGPHGWDALTHLCFSNYLRLERGRSEGFLRAARALLDAGASANTGWMEANHRPHPQWESALYGAAGVAHDAELTRLLLERGADPNDPEVIYHAPESYDRATLEVLVQSGRLTADSLATMLLRKADWHDHDGIKFLLEHGADPNHQTRWGLTALQQALRRDNALETIELLLDHGADPTRAGAAGAGGFLAACRGRADVLELFERRGISLGFQGAQHLIAACARNDEAGVRAIADRQPHLVREVRDEGGRLMAEFAGNGNSHGVRLLLDLGVDVAARYEDDDGYWGLAANSTALHVAAWRARHATVKLLLERGAPVNPPDARGRTPLALAVKACVDAYWTELRSPESVRALLQAGASAEGVLYPSGYAEVDRLLQSTGHR